MSVKAISKGVHMSPRKLGAVTVLVRGRSVDDALTILSHTPRRASLVVSKTIESAKANADYNHNFKPDSLMIVEISVTPGLRLKRFRPAARGRALPFQRKTAHVRVVVDGQKRAVKSKIVNKKSKSDSSDTKEAK